jgi:3-mercaptopyruvate sulfurtransferase SseA
VLYLGTEVLENPDDWNRRSPEELDAALRSLGVTHDTTVIVYGRDTEGTPTRSGRESDCGKSPPHGRC